MAQLEENISEVDRQVQIAKTSNVVTIAIVRTPGYYYSLENGSFEQMANKLEFVFSAI